MQTVFQEGTRHFVAYKTLEDVQQNFNLECLECHVTFDRKNINSTILSLPPEMQQVGCEVCHGPGKIHASDPKSVNIIRKPPADICAECHTAERDDNFDYDSKLIIIGCPAL